MALNFRQQKFVEEFILCGNAAEAYRRAGYRCANTQVAAASAEKLLRNAEIRSAVEAGRSAAREQAIVTRDDILRGLLREARRIRNGNPNARVASWKLLAEIQGYLGEQELRKMLEDLTRRLDARTPQNGRSSSPKGGGPGASG